MNPDPDNPNFDDANPEIAETTKMAKQVLTQAIFGQCLVSVWSVSTVGSSHYLRASRASLSKLVKGV
jgi:hypothetical protein